MRGGIQHHLGKAELFFLSLQDQTQKFLHKNNVGEGGKAEVGTGNQLERGLAKSRSHKNTQRVAPDDFWEGSVLGHLVVVGL